MEREQVAGDTLAVEAPDESAAARRPVDGAVRIRLIHLVDVPADQVAGTVAAEQADSRRVGKQDAAAVSDGTEGPQADPVEQGVMEMQPAQLNGAVPHGKPPGEVSTLRNTLIQYVSFLCFVKYHSVKPNVRR